MNINNSKDLAYITGIYLTDGYIHSKNGRRGLRLRNIDRDIHEYYLDRIFSITGRRIKLQEYKTGYSSTVYESEICDSYLVETMTNETKLKAIIPIYIHEMNIEDTKEFLAGLLDGDGWCSVSEKRRESNPNPENSHWHATIGIAGKQDSYIRFLPKILNKLNIKFSMSEVKTEKGTLMFSYRLDNRGCVESDIYFHCQRKQEKFELIKQYNIGLRYSPRRTETISVTQDNYLDE